MIDREDMLALTRRMTVKRTSMTRIAGGYMDSDGCIDGTFNIAFLKLSPADREKNLQIAKKVPFAETNQNLQEYKILQENMQNDSLWKLLMGMRACGLKNDALMETFYEIVGANYKSKGDYAVYVFHDRYDIPVKGTDHERQGEPECGFLFPAFMDESAALNYIDIYQADMNHPHIELLEMFGI